ncbi:MAG: potassium channel family protein [Microcoleaceae cyanobacterium]
MPVLEPQDRFESSAPIQGDYFLVCGLGDFGQYCVMALGEFGVPIKGINLNPVEQWEISNLPDLLDELIIGDCRRISVLEQAQIQRCRAALLVASDERVNTETALAIRRLNPNTRLVSRSSKENLNQLLSQQLGNFVAFEPTQLPAAAFALAALGSEILGFFKLEGQQVHVIQRQLQPDDPWCQRSSLQDLNSRTRRILCHILQETPISPTIHGWEPTNRPQPGDIVTYLEIPGRYTTESLQGSPAPRQQTRSWQRWVGALRWSNLKEQLLGFWKMGEERPLRRAAVVYGAIVILLLWIGTILFHGFYTESTFPSAFYGVVILLLGGYGDLFGEFEPSGLTPGWLKFIALGFTLAGTALVGVLYALLTEALLRSRFQFIPRRPPIPSANHSIVVGLGRVGQQVAVLLQEFKQSVVGVSANQQLDQTLLPSMPLVVTNIIEALNQVNLPTAKSVVVLTDDDMLNFEIGLMARAANPRCTLVIRTTDQGLSERLSQLLPHSSVLCAYGVAAEVFAGAAFGENILGLFRLGNQTILVTEYRIEGEDTLNGLLLGEAAYGYGIMPVLHQAGSSPAKLLPSDEVRLEIGDRLVVLATIDGLKATEQGNIAQKAWKVQVEKALTSDAAFEGANLIVRISGCSLNLARDLMNNLPAALPVGLYKHQAYLLVQELRRLQVIARIVEDRTSGETSQAG